MLKKGMLILVAMSLFSGNAYSKPGDIDLSFNEPSGMIFYEPGTSGNGVAIQADGKIVVVGTVFNGMNDDILLLRYLDDGRFDPTFGNNGIATFDGPAQYIDNGNSVTLQPDGKILIAGSSHGGPSQFDAIVVRYTPDGEIDPEFAGGQGFAVFNTPGNGDEIANAICVQPDGKIIVAGMTYNGSDNDVLILRFNGNGTPDTGFGMNGIVTYNHETNTDEEAMALALQPDGKIVVTGYTRNATTGQIVLLLRFNPDGKLDNDFGGGDGIVTYSNPVGGPDGGNAVAIQADGKIVVAGVMDLTFLLTLRFNGNGTLDESFGSSGVSIFAGAHSGTDRVYDMALQPDGKIVVAGTATYDAPDLVVLRYTNQGLLDDTFGDKGVFRYNSPAMVYPDVATGVAVASDGKIVVVGNSTTSSSNSDIITLRLIGQELLMLPAADFLINYPPMAEPLLSVDPFIAKPVSVGPIAEGVNLLDLRVGLSGLAGSVDLYLALYAPGIDPNIYFIIRSDNIIQSHTTGFVPWRSGTEGPLTEQLYGPLPLDGLTPGTYFFYLLAIPNGGLEGYYLWETFFEIP